MTVASTKLTAAVCGSGNRSRTVWQRHLVEHENFELVGVMDPSEQSLAAAVTEGHVAPEQIYNDLDRMLERTRPDALVVCPIHSAHASAIEAGLNAGCHILVEKPFTTEIEDAVRLTELAQERNLKIGVIQNWRSKSVGRALRNAIADGLIGDVSHVVFRYLRNREKPHLPDYLFDEPDPLLYAMAIHHLDLFRYILGEEIIHVDGRAACPSWSRYRSPSINDLWLETENGIVISYVASFSSRNAHIPQESLQVEGELGTLYNDSQFFEPPLLLSRPDDKEPIDVTSHVAIRDSDGQYELADLVVLNNFYQAITEDVPLLCDARENIGTLAVIDAVRKAIATEAPMPVEIPQLEMSQIA